MHAEEPPALCTNWCNFPGTWRPQAPLRQAHISTVQMNYQRKINQSIGSCCLLRFVWGNVAKFWHGTGRDRVFPPFLFSLFGRICHILVECLTSTAHGVIELSRSFLRILQWMFFHISHQSQRKSIWLVRIRHNIFPNNPQGKFRISKSCPDTGTTSSSIFSSSTGSIVHKECNRYTFMWSHLLLRPERDHLSKMSKVSFPKVGIRALIADSQQGWASERDEARRPVNLSWGHHHFIRFDEENLVIDVRSLLLGTLFLSKKQNHHEARCEVLKIRNVLLCHEVHNHDVSKLSCGFDTSRRVRKRLSFVQLFDGKNERSERSRSAVEGGRRKCVKSGPVDRGPTLRCCCKDGSEYFSRTWMWARFSFWSPKMKVVKLLFVFNVAPASRNCSNLRRISLFWNEVVKWTFDLFKRDQKCVICREEGVQNVFRGVSVSFPRDLWCYRTSGCLTLFVRSLDLQTSVHSIQAVSTLWRYALRFSGGVRVQTPAKVWDFSASLLSADQNAPSSNWVTINIVLTRPTNFVGVSYMSLENENTWWVRGKKSEILRKNVCQLKNDWRLKYLTE